MKTHVAADIFPMLAEAEYAALLADMRENGQRVPITVWCCPGVEDVILDGRNRARACAELGIPPSRSEFVGSEKEAIDLTVSLNMRRRDLTPGQRATIAVGLLPLYAAAAAAAKAATQGRPKNGGNKPALTGAPVSAEPRTQAKDARSAAGQAAAATGASRASVGRALALMDADPEAFEEVKAGKTSLGKAAKKKQGVPKREPDVLSASAEHVLSRLEAMSQRERAKVIQVINARWSSKGAEL